MARGFQKATRGKKHYKRGLDRSNKMRYFCKAFDVPQSQKNVSKISADISDNALSLLKIEKLITECAMREGQKTGIVRHI